MNSTNYIKINENYSMESEYINIYEFLSGAKKRFIIPVYQRDYSWRKTHCEKLWQDINNLLNQSEEK